MVFAAPKVSAKSWSQGRSIGQKFALNFCHISRGRFRCMAVLVGLIWGDGNGTQRNSGRMLMISKWFVGERSQNMFWGIKAVMFLMFCICTVVKISIWFTFTILALHAPPIDGNKLDMFNSLVSYHGLMHSASHGSPWYSHESWALQQLSVAGVGTRRLCCGKPRLIGTCGQFCIKKYVATCRSWLEWWDYGPRTNTTKNEAHRGSVQFLCVF